MGVKRVRVEFEPYQVEMEMAGEGRLRRAEQSREEMGSVRGEGSLAGWLAGWVK